MTKKIIDNYGEAKYYKGRYLINFYDEDDEWEVRSFNNIKEICAYKKLEINLKNYTLIKVELYRALKRPTHKTRRLDGTLMHVHLIDLIDDEDEYLI